MEGSSRHRHRGGRLAAEEEAANADAPTLPLPELALPELELPELPRLPEVDLSGDSSFQNYLAQQAQLLLNGCCASGPRPKSGCSVPDGADTAADAARAACGAGVAYAGVAGGCSAPPDIDRGNDAAPGTRRGGSRSPVPRPSLPLPYRSSRSPVQSLPGEEEEAEIRKAARRGRVSPAIAPFGSDGAVSEPEWAKPKAASPIFGNGVADGSRVDGCGL